MQWAWAVASPPGLARGTFYEDKNDVCSKWPICTLVSGSSARFQDLTDPHAVRRVETSVSGIVGAILPTYTVVAFSAVGGQEDRVGSAALRRRAVHGWCKACKHVFEVQAWEHGRLTWSPRGSSGSHGRDNPNGRRPWPWHHHVSHHGVWCAWHRHWTRARHVHPPCSREHTHGQLTFLRRTWCMRSRRMLRCCQFWVLA